MFSARAGAIFLAAGGKVLRGRGNIRLFRRQRFLVAVVALPDLVGKPGLRAGGDIIVAVSDLGHHRPRRASFRLGPQPGQFGDALGILFARRAKLHAVVEIVFRRVDERARQHAVGDVGAARQRRAERTGDESGGATPWPTKTWPTAWPAKRHELCCRLARGHSAFISASG
jgi:hypothetical protein